MQINAKPLPKTRRAVSTRRSMISFDTPVDDRFDTPARVDPDLDRDWVRLSFQFLENNPPSFLKRITGISIWTSTILKMEFSTKIWAPEFHSRFGLQMYIILNRATVCSLQWNPRPNDALEEVTVIRVPWNGKYNLD